jgi:bifunctional non-homologous end joining protein LigD
MSLELYKQQRSFKKTPEPTGGKSSSKALLFVVQKHHASHLHYDFRLEMKGVLKSWAVPKGPSMNPEERRLAQLVEDHPFDYKDFEGIIPEGNYGAGTVIIWDQGTYVPDESSGNKEEDEHLLIKQFYSGKISIVLKGKKLKGAFTLIKTAARGENAWLLSKDDDRYATEKNISEKDASVVSGLTIEEMAENPAAAKWKSNRSASQPTTTTKKTRKAKEQHIVIEPPAKKNYKQAVAFIKRDFKKAAKTEMPSHLKPMEATLIDEPFSDKDFQFEIKWDGYRSIAYVNNDEVNLRSKSNLPFNKNYPPVVDALQDWNINVVVDGEILVLNEQGKAEFNALQNWPRTREGNLFYYVFDILWLDGINLMHEPLWRRREILKRLAPENGIIRYSDSIDESGEQFFAVAKENGLEGIIAKKKNSRYFPDTRTTEWLKLPVEEIKEYVVVGYTESEANRPFSRIMFGNYHEDGKLYYVHHSGGGISDELMNSTYKILKKLEVKKKPVVNEAKEETPIHWVKPELIGRFKQKAHERTPSGKIRHPVIFLGLREDIKPKEVVEGKERKPTKSKNKKSSKNFDQVAVWKLLHDKEVEKTETITVEGKEIVLINYEQDYWQGITKLQLILYYQSIASYILPYLQNRPLGLNIVSKWAGEKGAKFLRNMKGNYPPWVEIFTTDRRIHVEGKSADIDWVVCNDMPTLMYMLNLGAVDLHPWSASVHTSNQPDYIVIDLDPDDTAEKDRTANTKNFKNVIKVAQAAKEYFDEQGLVSFVKTSGKTGMHLLLPCAGIEYGDTRAIAENICRQIHEGVPRISTINTSTGSRGGKVYIDASQNDYGDRLVAPYCVRAYKQPYVSTPLDWAEVNVELDRHEFKIDTIKERLEKKGDVFNGLFDTELQRANAKILESLFVKSRQT